MPPPTSGAAHLGRAGFRAYRNLGEAEGGVSGGYAELSYRPEEDTFLLKLHNGLEDELSATTEDHVAELVGKAAPVKVYIESFSKEGKRTRGRMLVKCVALR